MEIPFLSIADHVPEPGERWRVNFTRIDRPEGEATGAQRVGADLCWTINSTCRESLERLFSE
jgi:hypothetical protein